MQKPLDKSIDNIKGYDTKDEIIQKEHQLIEKTLKGIYENTSSQNIDYFIKQIKVLEKLCFNKNQTFVIWDHQKYQPAYMSDNVIDYGYTPEELYNMPLLILKQLYWKQIPSILKMINLRHHPFVKQMHKLPSQDKKVYLCGIRLKDRSGKWHSFFGKERELQVTEEGISVLSLIIVENINHLVGKNVFWLRAIGDLKQHKIKHTFNFDSSNKYFDDLLSDRQLEILHLIIQNKSIEAISETLNISTDTVKKHRKNMLARVGAKDMSALIYLCQLCELI